jgi:hypothetical protein
MDLTSLETEEENICVISLLKAAGLNFSGNLPFQHKFLMTQEGFQTRFGTP